MLFKALVPIAYATGVLSYAGDIPAPGFAGFAVPTSRGWSISTATDAPCGGLDASTRSDWPLSGGQAVLQFNGGGTNVTARFLSGAEISTSSTVNMMGYPSSTGSDTGTQCMYTPDFASLGYSAGDQITFQLKYDRHGWNEPMYSCSDVTLVEDSSYTAQTEYSCNTALESVSYDWQANSVVTATATDASSAAATAAVAAAAMSQKLTNLQSGWIGACAGVVFSALVALVAVYAVRRRFATKAQDAERAVVGIAVPASSIREIDGASLVSGTSMCKE
ncbi:hypothetical protein JCM8097_003717 [Rhodosporidiobolus ruineniae]